MTASMRYDDMPNYYYFSVMFRKIILNRLYESGVRSKHTSNVWTFVVHEGKKFGAAQCFSQVVRLLFACLVTTGSHDCFEKLHT
jgi:hypothetical protein